MKGPLKNVAASIHQRLLNLARESRRPFNELAQYYALERWLYRLSCSPHHGQFVLKGALLLLVWRLPVTRPTRDIDLLGRVSNDLESVRGILAAICQTPVEEDGMVFDAAGLTTSWIAEDADYKGVRAVFQATLGRVRLPMQIDIGFSDVITPQAVSVVYPTLLAHPAPELSAYNRETAIAEKFEAMVKLGELNTRMKDFFDVWALARTGTFRADELGTAVRQTFQRRGTLLTADPVCFGAAFTASPAKVVQWQAFVRRGRFEEPVPGFADVVSEVAAFLRPISAAMGEGGRSATIWRPGGPWTPSE